MTYYSDLTKYEYRESKLEGNTLNVGWLDGARAYQKGETSLEFHTRLLSLCNCFVNPTRGWHDCEFCAPQSFASPIMNRLNPFGGAEIRVFYQEKVYAAPNLIYHYVTEHGYRPPEEFIEAVLNGPLPGSSEYERLIASLGVDYWFDEENSTA